MGVELVGVAGHARIDLGARDPAIWTEGRRHRRNSKGLQHEHVNPDHAHRDPIHNRKLAKPFHSELFNPRYRLGNMPAPVSPFGKLVYLTL